MGTIEGVLFDIDGTLVESNDAHARAWVDAFSQFGWQMSFYQIKWMIGMGGDKLLAHLVPAMSDEGGIGKVIASRRKKIFLDQYAPLLKPTPGSRALVQCLKDKGFKLVIATSAKSQELQTLLKKAEVDGLFDEATTASDVNQSKPDPDVVQSALKQIGLPPEKVLMVGDTPYDVQAAERAGVGVVAVRSGGWDDESLEGAVAIYDNPGDILAHLDDSPFVKGVQSPE